MNVDTGADTAASQPKISVLALLMHTDDGRELKIVEDNHCCLLVELKDTGERRRIWVSDLRRSPDDSVWHWLPYWSASLDVPGYVHPIARSPRVADDRPSQWDRLLGPDLV